MTKAKYKAYEESVASFLKQNNIRAGCYGPTNDQDEGSFSHHQCGCCGSLLGGNRTNYTFVQNNGENFTDNICDDCIYYLEYGTLDDQTMLDMEDE